MIKISAKTLICLLFTWLSKGVMMAKTPHGWKRPVGETRQDSSWIQRERGGLTPKFPSTLWIEVFFNGHRSFYVLLESLHTQSHLLCLLVPFPFPAGTASLPVSILLVKKFTYSSLGCLHPFLSSSLPFFQVILFGAVSRICLFFLKTSLPIQLLLST